MEHQRIDLYNVLFIDTESDIFSKKPQSIQWNFRNEHGIIREFSFDSYDYISHMWNIADAVVFFNAPYDMGVLSIMYPQNGYSWVKSTIRGSYWDMELFRNRYALRKLGFFRNMIKPYNRITERRNGKTTRSKDKSTPVIDILKLWSILVEDGREGSISLKALIKRRLGKEPIPYSQENSLTEEYMYQDVDCLKELTEVLLHEVSCISDISHYTWSDWCYIKTPATFTKLSYAEKYPDIFEHGEAKKIIDERINAHEGLRDILERAFAGGLTIAFYRGTLENTGWFDISGAYVHAIEYMNTDSYNVFSISHHEKSEGYEHDNCLIHVKSNCHIISIDGSLKVFYTSDMCDNWYWYNDILACKNIRPDYDFEVLEYYKFHPEYPVEQSLPVIWSRQKDIEKSVNGKTTFYDFCKFRGNTSYGIRSQRKPFETQYTNMVISGMIVSKVHYILSCINNELENNGFEVLYNDTDSAAFYHKTPTTKAEINILEGKINSRISPYTVECEGYNKYTTVLSLKRYISEGGEGNTKIRIHGKGRYNIKPADIYDYVLNQKVPERPLKITQMAANTELSMKQMLNLFPYLEPYAHPFMFVTDIETEKVTMQSFFEDWYYHIDNKTTFKEEGEFRRYYRKFKDISTAYDFFRNFKRDENNDINPYAQDFDTKIQNEFFL